MPLPRLTNKIHIRTLSIQFAWIVPPFKISRSIVAIAGQSFAVIASDTRLSSGYSIHTRDQNKLFDLSGTTVLASTGCWCDTLSLTALVKSQMQRYEHAHNKTMSTTAVAQMLSILMYNRRFFPYYVSNVLAGLDENGHGVVYSYDPIGHYEAAKYRAGGSSGALLQPLLDNQIGMKNQANTFHPELTKERAIAIAKDAFISATERDIYTGDAVIIKVITQDGVTEERFELRKD